MSDIVVRCLRSGRCQVESGRDADIEFRSRLTQLRRRPPIFAVMHNAAFLQRCGRLQRFG